MWEKEWILPAKVQKTLDRLEAAGHEAYIVGGCVRDHLLGMEPHDWDITTSALPEEVRACFSRTYDTGAKHGTVTVAVEDAMFEVTTYRVDGKYADGRHPQDVTFTRSLVVDLRRRDFTMNAIAYHPGRGFQDPFAGRRDLDARVIRGVGDPAKRFQEDALRMLRAIRFSAQLGFAIEPETFGALRENAALIEKISGERIREEVQKLILAPYTGRAPLLWETGLLDLGRLDAAVLCPALERAGRTPAVRWALLMMGMEADGREALLARLKFDRKTETGIRTVLENRAAPPPQTLPQARRLLSTLGVELAQALLDFQAAVLYPGAQAAQGLCRCVLERGDPLFIKDLAINGKDLAALGVPTGRQMGRILQKLLEAVWEDPALNTPEGLKKQFS